MSDHIPDAGKMVSDTPRTDEQEHFIDGDRGIVDSGLARELERELNAANERIKRLEEAGDWAVYASDREDHIRAELAWRKAKEAKP